MMTRWPREGTQVPTELYSDVTGVGKEVMASEGQAWKRGLADQLS